MNRGYTLIDHESWQPFFSLLLFCGIGLVLTIPAARQVRGFDQTSFLPGIPIYLYVHALFMGILGLNIGATSAARGEEGRWLMPLLAERVGLAQSLTLPYFVFARALYPGKELVFALIILYTSIFSLLCAGASRLIEEPRSHHVSHGFVLKYALFLAYCVVPLIRVPVLSPLGVVAAVLGAGKASLLLIAYAAPLLLLAVVWLLLYRRFGGDRGV